MEIWLRDSHNSIRAHFRHIMVDFPPQKAHLTQEKRFFPNLLGIYNIFN